MATIFIQHIDGTVEALDVTPGVNPNQVVLAQAPRLPVSLDNANYARSTFVFVKGSASQRERAFLLTEKSFKSQLTSEIKAINYDSRYYANDTDSPVEDKWPWSGGQSILDRVMVFGSRTEVYYSANAGESFTQKNPVVSPSVQTLNLGRQITGTSGWTFGANYKYYNIVRLTALSNITISAIKFYCSNTSSALVRAVIYNTDLSFNPTTLIAASSTINGVVAGWNTITFDTPVTIPIPISDGIAIGIHTSASIPTTYNSATAGYHYSGYATDTFADGASDPFGTPSYNSWQFSMYAVATATAGDKVPSNQYFPLATWAGGKNWCVNTFDYAGTGKIYTSTDDGDTWNLALTLPAGSGLLSLHADPRRGYVAAYTYTSPKHLWISTNSGVSFTERTAPPTGKLSYEQAIKYVNGTLIQFGNASVTGLGVGVYSFDDGISWVDTPLSLLPVDSTIVDIVGNGSKIIAVGANTIYSKDSLLSDPVLRYTDTDSNVYFDTSVNDGSKFTVLSGTRYNTPRVMSSVDGVSWEQVTLDPALTRAQYLINGAAMKGKVVFGDDYESGVWIGPPWIHTRITPQDYQLLSGLLAATHP